MASTRSCPIAVEPTVERVDDVGGRGHRARELAGDGRLRFQPKRSAVSTSRLAPTLTPERGEDGVARVGERLGEGAAAGLAVGVVEVDAVDHRVALDRELVAGFTLPASSAAVVVTILNVEPGGWGAENAIPASARTSPLRGSSAAIPPRRPASAVTAAFWMRLSIVVRTGGPRAAGCARARGAGEQLPAGRAGDLGLERPLEAGRADGRVRSGSRARRARGGRAVVGRLGAISPAIEAPTLRRRWVRASAGPAARTLPSRGDDLGPRRSLVSR